MAKTSKHKITIVIVTIVTVIISVAFVLFYTPKKSTSTFPDTIDIDSKYYLQRQIALDYTITDYKDPTPLIVQSSPWEYAPMMETL